MKRRRGHRGVPEDLGVEVGVDVAESRCDDQPFGVNAASGLSDIADRDDPASGDTDVRPTPGGAGPIDDLPTPKREIEHCCLLS